MHYYILGTLLKLLWFSIWVCLNSSFMMRITHWMTPLLVRCLDCTAIWHYFNSRDQRYFTDCHHKLPQQSQPVSFSQKCSWLCVIQSTWVDITTCIQHSHNYIQQKLNLNTHSKWKPPCYWQYRMVAESTQWIQKLLDFVTCSYFFSRK